MVNGKARLKLPIKGLIDDPLSREWRAQRAINDMRHHKLHQEGFLRHILKKQEKNRFERSTKNRCNFGARYRDRFHVITSRGNLRSTVVITLNLRTPNHEVEL